MKLKTIFLILGMIAMASCKGLGLDACDGDEWYRDDPRRNSGVPCPSARDVTPSSRLDASRAQRITSSSAPRETPTTQNARQAAIASRSDSLLMSSRAIENYSRNRPFILLPPTQCSGTRCSFRDPEGFVVGATFAVSSFAPIAGGRAILTKHGITMVETWDDANTGYLGYSSILRNSAFGVGRQRTRWPNRNTAPYLDRRAYSYGDLSSERPAARASWRGLMVGMPQRSDEILQGDATLSYTIGGDAGTLNASFTNIRNLSRNAAHSTPSAGFTSVAVDADGTFAAGSARNRISGAFFGTDQVEAAGVFEQSGMIGAFGARRQASP